MKQRYQVSEEFKAQCKANVGKYKQGIIYIIEDDLTITGNDNLIDFTIEDFCYVNDRFIGTTVSKKITINILNDDGIIDLEGKTIQVSTGCILEDGTEEIIPLGNYIVETSSDENVKKKTSFTGYDYMIKFNTKYIDIVTYPITLYDYLISLCNKLNIELENESIINGEYEIQGNPFTNNETNMTVLSNICQLAGGFGKITRENKLKIITLVKDYTETNAVETIDGNNYDDTFSKNKEWGEVNSLILRLSDIEGENTTREDAESITTNGLTELTLADNYFLTDSTQRELVIEALWETLKGLKYLPFNTEYYGYPYLDTGDLILLEDNEGNVYYTYVLNHTIKYNGIYTGNIETTALTETQTVYKNTTIQEKFKKTEYIIDKINGQITQIVEIAEDAGEKATEAIQTVEGITTEIRDTTDQIQDKITQIQETIDGIVIDKTVTGGQNLIRNSVGYFNNEYWQIDNENEGTVVGNTISDVKQNSISGSALELQNETIYQNITEIKNGEYYLSFAYKKLEENAICSFKINETEINLNEMNWTNIEQLIVVTGNSIRIEITTDINSSCLITDLMLSEGNIKTSWTQNANESYTDGVQIGKGLKIKSTGTDTEFEASANGIVIKNTNNNQNVAEFTKYGTETEELTVNKNIKITNALLIQKVGNQVWFCSL